MKKLYVGNLPYSFNDVQLSQLFSKYGTVESAVVIMDRETGRSKGFGFVEIDNEGAKNSMKELGETEIEGRALKVNEAKPMEDRKNFRR